MPSRETCWKKGFSLTTIYDIAKRAGVSSATVSKVLNGYPDVNRETRARVEAITQELGYKQNAVARGLATKRSMTIGVFFRDHANSGLRHPFFADVLASFKDVIGVAGYDLLFFANNAPDNVHSGYEDRARHRNVDGLLLLGVWRTDPGLEAISRSSIPCLSVDLDLLGPRASYLVSDNVDGAKKAVDYLVQCGHTRIAFVGDRFSTKPGHDRLVGYQQGLEHNGLLFRHEWVLDGDFTEEGGRFAMERMLELPDLPTAIFFAGDMMAIGGMELLKQRGYVIPEDFSIIGFDDIVMSSHLSPALTTIRQKRGEMGTRAAQELLELIHKPGKPPSGVVVDVELVARETVRRVCADSSSSLASSDFFEKSGQVCDVDAVEQVCVTHSAEE